MAKKKAVKKKKEIAIEDDPTIVKTPGGLEVLGELTGEDYWRWRCTIEERVVAQQKQIVANQTVTLKEKDLTIGRHEFANLKKAASDNKKTVDAAHQEYDKILSELGKKLGSSLKDCVIDPYTYEVRKLPKS
jgi:hypothetical protein